MTDDWQSFELLRVEICVPLSVTHLCMYMIVVIAQHGLFLKAHDIKDDTPYMYLSFSYQIEETKFGNAVDAN